MGRIEINTKDRIELFRQKLPVFVSALCIFLFAYLLPVISFNHHLYAQTTTDSLILKLNEETKALNKVKLLTEIGKNYVDSDNRLSIQYLIKADQIAKSNQLKEAIPSIYSNLSKAYFRASDNDSSRYYAHKVLEYYQKNDVPPTENLGKAYNQLGILAKNKDSLFLAINHYNKAIEYSELLQDSSTLAYVNIGLGNLYRLIDDRDQSKIYLEKGEQIYTQINNTRGSFLAGLNLVGLEFDKGHYESAKAKYQALERKFSDSKYHFYTVILYNQLCQSYAYLGDIPKAKSYLDKAINLSNEKGFPDRFLYIFYRNKGIISFEEGNLKLSKKHFQRALSENKLLNDQELKKTSFEYLAKIAILQEDYKSALEYKTQYFELKNAISNKDRLRKFYFTSNKISFEKEQEQENLLFQQQLKDQRRSLFYLAFALLCLGVFFFLLRESSLRKRRNEELASYNTKLKEVNKDLEQFAYAASHDLQRPLHNILVFNSFIDKKFSSNFSEELKQSFSYVNKAGYKLKNLLDGLLKYATTGSKIEFKQMDLNKVLKSITQNLEPELKAIKATVSYDKMPIIQGSKKEISFLFKELISNAIKYKQEDIPPLIQISYTENKTHYTFHIKDNAKGFNNKYKDKIFQIFQQLDVKSYDKNTGAGLAICKKIVTLHEGIIDVNSEENKGSTFSFSIKKQVMPV